MSDAIENCVRAIDNYDVTKYDNPFSYITTVVQYAFWRRIAGEKKQLYIKYKLLEESMSFGHMSDRQHGDILADYNEIDGYSDSSREKMLEFMEEYEKKEEERRLQRKIKNKERQQKKKKQNEGTFTVSNSVFNTSNER